MKPIETSSLRQIVQKTIRDYASFFAEEITKHPGRAAAAAVLGIATGVVVAMSSPVAVAVLTGLNAGVLTMAAPEVVNILKSSWSPPR